MKKELTYTDAYAKLQDLIGQLEDDKIPLDKLALTIKQANEWIAICDAKLRTIDAEVNAAVKKSIKQKKKNGG